VAYAQMRLSESESANGTKQIFFWGDTF